MGRAVRRIGIVPGKADAPLLLVMRMTPVGARRRSTSQWRRCTCRRRGSVARDVPWGTSTASAPEAEFAGCLRFCPCLSEEHNGTPHQDPCGTGVAQRDGPRVGNSLLGPTSQARLTIHTLRQTATTATIAPTQSSRRTELVATIGERL